MLRTLHFFFTHLLALLLLLFILAGEANSQSGSGGNNGGSSGTGNTGGTGNNSGTFLRPIPYYLLGRGERTCGARESETIETPEVNCEQDNTFLNRVDEYFTYTPPPANRQALTNYANQVVNTPDRYESFVIKPPGHRMDFVDCETQPNNAPVSEPCQDNRWRDACLMGIVPLDLDYYAYGRPLYHDEEPWPSVIGAKPLVNINDMQRINCMVPKNTENIPPILMNQGWTFRHSCPDDPLTRRIPRDVYREKTDLFRGATKDSGESLFNCWAPLPKCDIEADWKIGTAGWIGREFGKYVNLFNPASTNPITGAINNFLGGIFPGATQGTLEQLLSRFTTDAQRDAAIDWLKNHLLKPTKSRAAECKPAYWARLMMDSCANQFIAQKSFSPSLIFNPDGRKPGLSYRMCQPLKTVDVSDHEYNPHDYLRRTAIGLLHEDYFPTMKYDRFVKNLPPVNFQRMWEKAMKAKGYPIDGKIEGLRMNTAGQLDTTADIFGNPDINQYLNMNVERILDAYHPFSPRYDIAETLTGEFITDRTLFEGETESNAVNEDLCMLAGIVPSFVIPTEYPCTADPIGEGYFEFGDPIYCSAVEVDLLRFRYADYRICMGCHIDANKEAFWDEVEINTEHYEKERCGVGKFGPFDKSDYSDCIYCTVLKGEVCGSCHRSNWKFVQYGACCAATLGLGCTNVCAKEFLVDAIFYGLICNANCKPMAANEALEGARQQKNAVQSPKWGPTGAGPLGAVGLTKNKWPTCSTRFDKEDAKLFGINMCNAAKMAYGFCSGQAVTAGTEDPHMKLAPDIDTGRKCAMEWSIEDICHNAAKPVVPLNTLALRLHKGGVKTDQPLTFQTERWKGNASTFPAKLASYRNLTRDEHPEVLTYDYYFGAKRPYMRWHDTGKEAFQMEDDKPDYWCDFGRNTVIRGVGREANSIHGSKSQLCRYVGGAEVGDSCFEMSKWKDRFPELGGSEWAELKMYQARCFRRSGLNCLCQYEKIFKDESAEEFALNALGGRISGYEILRKETATEDEIRIKKGIEMLFSWRGYASTPANRDTALTSPAISNNQQFPYLYDTPPSGAVIRGRGLSHALPGDVVIWPAGLNPPTAPRVAVVTNAVNQATFDNQLGGRIEFVTVRDANNGKFPDICGNTTMLGYGPKQTLYKEINGLSDALGEGFKKLLEESPVATYYCDDPYLRHCVDRYWNQVIIYRPGSDRGRKPPIS